MVNTEITFEQKELFDKHISILFKEFPYSNIHQQWTLSGRDAMPEARESLAYKAKHALLDVSVCGKITDLAKECDLDEELILLAAYHLLVQKHLNNDESVIAMRRIKDARDGQPTLELSASYYYLEEGSTANELVSELADFQTDSPISKVSSSDFVPRLATKLPLFYFDIISGCEQKSDLGFSPVSLSIKAEVSGTWIQVRVLEGVSENLDTDLLLGEYLSLLSTLLSSPRLSLEELYADEQGEENSLIVDSIQLKMKGLWQQVLNVDIDDIKLSSCYFSLGGTSLNAFLLVNKIRSEFDQELSIRNVVENSTLKELSEKIASGY
jgi:acyl carrier protein